MQKLAVYCVTLLIAINFCQCKMSCGKANAYLDFVGFNDSSLNSISLAHYKKGTNYTVYVDEVELKIDSLINDSIFSVGTYHLKIDDNYDWIATTHPSEKTYRIKNIFYEDDYQKTNGFSAPRDDCSDKFSCTVNDSSYVIPKNFDSQGYDDMAVKLYYK